MKMSKLVAELWFFDVRGCTLNNILKKLAGNWHLSLGFFPLGLATIITQTLCLEQWSGKIQQNNFQILK